MCTRNGTPLCSNVWGKIETNAKLSGSYLSHFTFLSLCPPARLESDYGMTGTPDLLLTFTNPHVLTDCAFHPCVRYVPPHPSFSWLSATASNHLTYHSPNSLQRWTRDKSLSFVPPDGHFILLDYRYVPSGSAVMGTSTPGLRGELVPVPIVLKTSIEINEFGGMLPKHMSHIVFPFRR